MTIVEPKVNTANVATRLACFCRDYLRSHPGRALPINCKALAFTFRLSPDWIRKGTMRLRTRAWAFQEYGIILFVRYRRHKTSRCGHPQIYAIGRHYCHAIAGKVRWHLHKRSVEDWQGYVDKLANLAFGKIFRKRDRGDGTHKALSSHDKDRKIGNQTAKSTRLRGFKSLAGRLALDHVASYPASGTWTRSWAALRLNEGHSYGRVLECLGHAVSTLERHLYKKDGSPTGWECPNPKGWIQAVAARHLDWDGLTPKIRWRQRLKAKRHGAGAPTFKVERSAGLSRLAEMDRKREALRERKTLPNGRQIEYDPFLGAWKDL